MKLTKRQIQQIELAHKKALAASLRFESLTNSLCAIITDITKVEGFVDHLAGDGFGFTPESNNDVHIPIDTLIKLAVDGVDITEKEILANLSL